jgi:3-oxoadipate enol-lactonase
MLTIYVNGINISYERRGRGTPLVLLHGYPLDHSIWEPVVLLLENDFDLIMPDLRGFGSSDLTGEPYGMPEMAEDISLLLDKLGIWQAAIAGHSMGGYVALAFARAHPQRVTGLSLVASQVLPDALEKKSSRYEEAEYILKNGVREVADGMSAKLTVSPDLQAWLRALILSQRPQGLAGALKAMAERPDSSALLPDADFPVVLIHGEADLLIPVERARRVKAAVGQALLVEIPHIGHMPMMEASQATADGLKKLVK